VTADLLGSRVLVAVTCLDPKGREVDSFEAHGVIERCDEAAIVLRRDDFGGVFGLPPEPELLQPADPDVPYDYVVRLTARVADAESLLEIRGVGFVA
jgi:hypothetical protein